MTNPSEQMLRWFTSAHLPEDLREVSQKSEELAVKMAAELPPSAELTAGLRKLLEAKDCFVRARIAAREA